MFLYFTDLPAYSVFIVAESGFSMIQWKPPVTAGKRLVQIKSPLVRIQLLQEVLGFCSGVTHDLALMKVQQYGALIAIEYKIK